MVITTTSLLVSHFVISNNTETTPFYVGVSFCGNTTPSSVSVLSAIAPIASVAVVSVGLLVYFKKRKR